MEWLVIFVIVGLIYKWLFVDSSKGFHLARVRALKQEVEALTRHRGNKILAR